MGDKPLGLKRKPKRSYTPRKRAKLAPSLFQLFDLNDDCLLHIFECFDLITLAKMCRTCKRFRDLIMRHIIPFRTIDFSEIRKIYSVRRMFALFGKSMQRIVMDSDDIQITMPGYSPFAEFLRMLVEYGEPGTLKDVRLKFGGYVPDKLLQDAGPYFSQVQKLDFNSNQMRSHDLNAFLNAIDKGNLRELYVRNVSIVGEWLSGSSLDGLQKIHLSLCSSRVDRVLTDALNESRLKHFISNKPASLIAFECTGALSEQVFVELSRHIPNIERLSVVKYWTNATGNVNNNNNGGAGGIVPTDFHAKWKYFDAFTNLKDVSLRSTSYDFSDLGEAFSILAKRQTIERLELDFAGYIGDQGNPVKVADLKRLTRLKTLDLNFYDEKSMEFVSTLIANLPALTTLILKIRFFNLTQPRFIELIESAKNLKELKLCSGFSSLSVPFYKKLVKSRTPADDSQNMNGNENRLVLHIDGEIARKCVNGLGKRYKPSIVMLRSI